MKCATVIHDLQQATVAKPQMRFTVKELLRSGAWCIIWLIQNPLPYMYSFLTLSSSCLAPCSLADATVMWSTLRCSSHNSLMALLTSSLRRKRKSTVEGEKGGMAMKVKLCRRTESSEVFIKWKEWEDGECWRKWLEFLPPKSFLSVKEKSWTGGFKTSLRGGLPVGPAAPATTPRIA